MFGENCYKFDKKSINIAEKIFSKTLDFFKKFRYSSVKSNKKLSASLTLA